MELKVIEIDKLHEIFVKTEKIDYIITFHPVKNENWNWSFEINSNKKHTSEIVKDNYHLRFQYQRVACTKLETRNNYKKIESE